LLSSKIKLCESSLGSLPMSVSLGRAITWAIGAIVCVPQDSVLMNG
jgi:hypothetical protein